MDKQSFLAIANPLNALPSPKQSRIGATDWARTIPFFPAYSEAFASAAIHLLHRKKSDVLLDPFVGCGTTLHAAKGLNLNVTANDLDPVSILYTRLKAIRSYDAAALRALTSIKSSKQLISAPNTAAQLADLFQPGDISYITSVEPSLRCSSGTKRTPFTTILNTFTPKINSQVIFLSALCLASKEAGRTIKGSNPVWYRSSPDQPDLFNSEPLRDLTLQFVDRICVVLADTKEHLSHNPVLTCADFHELEPPSIRFDMLVTSPPYLNRLDYVVNHYSELALLNYLFPLDLTRLRGTMFGTTLMIDHPEPQNNWGPTCLKLLKQIIAHPSHASAGYYLRFHTQYFKSLWDFLGLLKRAANPRAHGLLVIQNSFYKEIAIDIVGIFIEMATSHGISCREVR